MKSLGRFLDAVRGSTPLVHCITNVVTVNDVANALLAIGGSPVMSDEPDDVADLAGIASALVLNIGTLNRRSIEAMFVAGRVANRRGIPVVLDPVGAGATALRTDTARRLLAEVRVAAVRGNLSELRALAGDAGAAARGVDAALGDKVTDPNLPAVAESLRAFAAAHGCLVAATGAIDVVASGSRAYALRNGRPEMSRITGTGCQLTAICAAFLAAAEHGGADGAEADAPLLALSAAVASMGVAGEAAFARLQAGEGNATYRNRILDSLCHLDAAALDASAQIAEVAR